MSIFSHNVYDNVRTRVIVPYERQLLLLTPGDNDEAWQLPGGGLEPHESLFECGEREVREETGLHVKVTGVAFLREWVVPTYCVFPDSDGQYGYGLEVYLYGQVLHPMPQLQPEPPDIRVPQWVPLDQINALPLWPKEIKTLAALMLSGAAVQGVPLITADLDDAYAPAPPKIDFV